MLCGMEAKSDARYHPETMARIFRLAIDDYHAQNILEPEINNPFTQDKFTQVLYAKAWIDTIQWHIEDEIRAPDIALPLVLAYKRKIDALNQRRTDTVEQIEDLYSAAFAHITPRSGARFNTETIGWAIDRLSILQLKIVHMTDETLRPDATQEHKRKCEQKCQVLHQQHRDLCTAISALLEDIQSGVVHFHTYRQMKMYNSADLNPVLYRNSK